jgi:hypothetical protein
LAERRDTSSVFGDFFMGFPFIHWPTGAIAIGQWL